MATEVISKYISERYKYWLDYAIYHSVHAGIEDEARDVLNEVLAMLLEKKERYLMELYERKKGNYRELDYFILKMIKLNIQSPTSPYQHKYKPIPVDENVDYRRLDLPDVSDTGQEEDYAGELLEKMHCVRNIIDSLDLSEKAKRIFSFKFFEGESFSDWEGPEDRKDLYSVYNGVLELIRGKINGKMLM